MLLLAGLLAFPLSSAERLIESRSLNPCKANSNFTASLFNVVFTPDNNTLTFNIIGVSEIEGNVTAELDVFAYGHKVLNKVLDPCEQGEGLAGICPMRKGQIDIHSNIEIPADVIKQVPSIAYTIPDLDGVVQVYINETATRQPLACLEAELSNGKTVYQKSVAWVVAVIAGIGLVASAISSGLGHSNTAAHVAANAMSLFGYFQSQAIFGMSSVELPPIVASWTQNFQWSMGIVRISFLQRFGTWYLRATGGAPTNVLANLSLASVSVQKRSLDVMQNLYTRAIHSMVKRTNNNIGRVETPRMVVVHGIERVGFRANIELSNIFMTGYTVYILFVFLVVLSVLAFKAICEALVKAGKLKGDKFQEFRNGWSTVLKGILFRLVLIGYTQMCVLCFWELVRRDSAAEVALAVLTITTMIASLAWASSKVILIARRSITMHKNPAYILYSDPVALNKWGFLYVQFKASSYYFIVPILVYILIKGMFIGIAQHSGTVQAVALVLIEGAFLVAVSVIRPFMDKKTNAFNISIAAVNFLSSLFLLIFTEVFNQPGIVTGVVGVIFFAVNAVFALILLLMVLVASVYGLVSKNPDARYQPMRDDRGSFIKSQTQLTTELDALGAAARGEPKTAYNGRDDDGASLSSDSIGHMKYEGHRSSSAIGSFNGQRDPRDPPPRSPIDPSMPLFPSDGSGRGRHEANPYRRPRNDPSQYRTRNNGSPWQRGAGYD